MPQSPQSQEQHRRISPDQVQRSHNIPELSEIILSMPAWMSWQIIHRTIYNIYSHQSKCLNLSDFRPLCIFFQDGKESEGSLLWHLRVCECDRLGEHPRPPSPLFFKLCTQRSHFHGGEAPSETRLPLVIPISCWNFQRPSKDINLLPNSSSNTGFPRVS